MKEVSMLLKRFITYLAIVTFSCLIVSPAPGAFPVKIPKKAATIAHRHLPFALKKLSNSLPGKYRNGHLEGSDASGILSFIFGATGFALLIIALASFATLAWFYLSLTGLGLGITAIILGAPHRKKHKGWGTAGVIFGIIDIILVGVVFGTVLSGLSSLGS